MMRILVVEDEAMLADVIARGLRQAGFAVDIAPDGESALEHASATDYDAVVLDRQLPGLHGDDVCRTLIAAAPAPRILMLTAAGSIDARVEGFAIGADDYLPKPFAMAELVARLRALVRRTDQKLPPVLSAGDLVVDLARRRVLRGSRELHLTPKEVGTLEVLLSPPGRVVSAEELLERVWDEHADPFTNAIRITIMTLRRKLGDPPLIETVIGTGYRLVDQPDTTRSDVS